MRMIDLWFDLRQEYLEISTMREMIISLDNVETTLKASIQRFFNNQLSCDRFTQPVLGKPAQHESQQCATPINDTSSNADTGEMRVEKQRSLSDGCKDGQLCSFTGFTQQSQNNKKKRSRHLAKEATKVLEDWIVRNFDDPYPSFEEKLLLSHSSGLTVQQVTNWFINRRVKMLTTKFRRKG